MTTHYHILVAQTNKKIMSYLTYNDVDRSIYDFIMLSKQLAGAKVNQIEYAYKDMKHVFNTQEDFFISVDGRLMTTAWLNCWEGKCRKEFFN